MNTFKFHALSCLTTGILVGGFATATPSLAAGPLVHHKPFERAPVSRQVQQRRSADADFASATPTPQCENVEQHYAAALKEHPGMVPGDASSWAQWAADQNRAIASSPICR